MRKTLSVLACAAHDGSLAGPGGTVASRSVDLRHGLNDLRPRGRRGIEKSGRCGIGGGQFEQGPCDGEAEAGQYGIRSAVMGTHSQERIHAEINGGVGPGRIWRM